MKRLKLVGIFVAAALCLVPNLAGAFERFEIGARLKSVVLADDEAESFVGTINGLDERDPRFVPFVRYRFAPAWSLELAYNQLRIHTLKPDASRSGISTDGDFLFRGPAAAVIGGLPNATPCKPYLGAGATYFIGGFDPTAEWARTGDKRRHMHVPDVLAPTAFVGMEFRIWRNLSADLRAGYEWASADIGFSADINGTVVYDKGPYHVPLGNHYWSAGLTYLF